MNECTEEKYQAKGVVVFGLGRTGIEITKHLDNLNVFFLDNQYSGLQFSGQENVILLKESSGILNPFNAQYRVKSQEDRIKKIIKNRVLFVVCGADDQRGLHISIACEVVNFAKKNEVPVIGFIKNPDRTNSVIESKMQELKDKLNYTYFYKGAVGEDIDYLEQIVHKNNELEKIIKKMALMLEDDIMNRQPIISEKLEYLIIDNILDANEDFNDLKQQLLMKQSSNYKCRITICTSGENASYKRGFYETEIRRVWSGISFVYWGESDDSNKVQIIFMFYK